MFKLYDYQFDLVSRLSYALRDYNRVVAQSPTGSGKTVMFSDICSKLARKNKKVLLLTDLTELKKSTHATMSKFLRGVKVLGDRQLPFSDVTIAMAQTVARRLNRMDFKAWLLRFDFFIIDEAHMAFNNRLILEVIMPHEKKLIGFTATPIMPLGNKLLMGDLYEWIELGPFTTELINRGKLSKPNYIISGLDNTTDFRVKHFDFDPIEVKAAFDKPIIFDSLYQNIIDHKREKAQSLVFCNDIFHAYKTCEDLNRRGIKAKCLTSTPPKPSPPKVDNAMTRQGFEKKKEEYAYIMKMMELYSGERSQIIKDWEEGEFHFLLNSKILMTGFDSPTILDIHLFYSGLSFREFNQRVGRGARIIQGIKESFNVFDYGQNIQNLTVWETAIEYKLYKKSDFEEAKKKMKKIKACPWCNMPLLYETCSCGYEDVKAIQIREHANLQETNLQKVINYADVKEEMETQTMANLIGTSPLPYAKLVRFIWINKKEQGIAEFAFEKGKNINTFVRELDHRKFNLSQDQKARIFNIHQSLTN